MIAVLCVLHLEFRNLANQSIAFSRLYFKTNVHCCLIPLLHAINTGTLYGIPVYLYDRENERHKCCLDLRV